MPEIIVRGLKFIDDRTDQEIGEYGVLLDTDKSISSSCSEGQGEETVIVYDVQPWMKEAEVRSIFNATKAAEPKRLRPVSWTPGDTDLAAWRVQVPGVEASMGRVIRDRTKGQNVYVISLREYSSERTREGVGQETPRPKQYGPHPNASHTLRFFWGGKSVVFGGEAGKEKGDGMMNQND